MSQKTIRLTMTQALVRYLCNQFTEIDGERVPLFAGVFVSPACLKPYIPCKTSCPPGAGRMSNRWRWPPLALPRPSAAVKSW